MEGSEGMERGRECSGEREGYGRKCSFRTKGYLDPVVVVFIF